MKLLVYFQNICGQQGLNTNGGAAQQSGTKACLIQNPGIQLNIPQQGSVQNNPQQAFTSSSTQTNSFQPQLAVQNNPGNTNQLSDIFSALHNIRLYQTPNVNPSAKYGCISTQNTDQSTISSFANKPSVNQGASQTDSSKLQPSFTFRFIPVTPQSESLQNSQYYLSPATSQQANYVSQPTPTNVASPQTSTVQSSTLIPVSSSQVNPVQSQPIVFALQSPQYTEIPGLSSQPLAQTPVMYSIQLPTTNQDNSQLQTSNNFPGDDQSMMSLLMSQLQNPSSNQSPTPAMIPRLLNGKQEKSSGMKALLPLLFNMLNDKRSCGCNQCGHGCPNQEPTINSGYSSQKNYSQKEKLQALKESDNNEYISKKNVISNDSEERSDEDEEYDDEDEE